MFKRIFLSLAFVATFAIAATFNSTANAHGGGYYGHGHHHHHGHGGYGYGYGSYYRPYVVGPPIIRGSYYPAQFYGGYYAPYYDPYYYGPPRSGVIIGW